MGDWATGVTAVVVPLVDSVAVDDEGAEREGETTEGTLTDVERGEDETTGGIAVASTRPIIIIIVFV